MTDLTQLDKLEAYLREHDIPYDRIDRDEEYKETPHGKILSRYERHQIIIRPQDGEREWSVICFRGSYGYEKGLLEVMKTLYRKNYNDTQVEGWLTANAVIKRIERAMK